MAGEYIEFVNNSQPALNEDNLNLMQQRIKQDIQGAVSGDTLPVGAIMPFGSDTIPENWLLCNGQAVSRTEYQDLFNTIGITFGQGDGFTTFNLPNLKGKVVVGKDGNDTDFDMLGETGGEKEHTLTIQEMPSHKHGATNFIYNSDANPFYINTSGTEKLSTATSQIDVDSAGGGQPHNILQPYQVQNYIIKAKQSAGVVAQVIDNLNSTSITDALSANQGRLLKGITLFEDANGVNTNITLNETAANFDYIEIFFARKGSTTIFSSEKVYNPNGKYVQLSFNNSANDVTMQIYGSRLYINGTTISREQNTMFQMNDTGFVSMETPTALNIYKIVGYK